MDQDKIQNFERGPSIDVSYEVLVHLAERFQRTTDNGRQTPGDCKSSHFLWQGELKRKNNELQYIIQKTKGLTARTPI